MGAGRDADDSARRRGGCRVIGTENIIGGAIGEDVPGNLGAFIDVGRAGISCRHVINDIDGDGDRLTAVLTGDTQHGTLDLQPDGSFTYTPDSGYFGEDTFNYIICDDGTPSLCDSATVTIKVARVTFEVYLPLIYRN